MTEKKEYRSSIRSRQMIRKAFLELLEEKEYKKITVTDIVRRADLNRSTFYAHYPDVQGLVEYLQKEIFMHDVLAIENMELESFTKDPGPYLQKLAELLRENVELFKRLGHTEDIRIHLDEFRRMTVSRLRNNDSIPQSVRELPAFTIQIHFFIGGMMNIYQQWADGQLECSLEEISEQIGKLIVLSSNALLSQMQ